MNAYVSPELSTIKALDPRRHELALQTAEFLSHQGTIQILEGPRMQPHPARYEPPPSVKVAANSKYNGSYLSTNQIAERMTYVSSIGELAKTMTIDEAMKATGKSESAMRRAASEGDFKFVAKSLNRENDLRLIDRLSALRDAGISRRMACSQVQISPTLICRLEQDYNFVYPKRRVKPKQ